MTDLEYVPTCTGCNRPTYRGRLCHIHYGTLNRALADAPNVVAYTLALAREPARTTQATVTGTRVPPAPLAVVPASYADDLHAALMSWALVVADGNFRPPPKRGTAWTSTGDPCGVLTTDATRAVANWLRVRIDWVADRDYAPELIHEIDTMVGTAMARWPVEEAARTVQKVCPACNRYGSLIYYPPPNYMAPIFLQCQHVECGALIPQDKFNLYWSALPEEELVEEIRRSIAVTVEESITKRQGVSA